MANSPENKLSSIIGKSPVIVMVWENEPGWPVSYVTDSVQRLGYEPQDFLSGRIRYLDLIHGEDLKSVEENLRSVEDGNNPQMEQEYRLRTSKGSARWMHEWSSLKYDQHGGIIQIRSVIYDINDQIVAEQAMNDFAKFFLEDPDPVLRIDAAGDVTLANDRAQKLIQAISESGSEDQRDWKRFLKMVLATRQKKHLQLHLLDKTYAFIVVPIKERDYLNVYGKDITQLQEQESRFQDLVQDLPGAVFQYKRSADGNESIDLMSPGFALIWGIVPEQLEKDPTQLWNVAHKEDVAGLQDSVSRSAQSLTRWDHIWRIVLPDSGEIKWLHGVGTPHRLKDGSVQWNSIVFDVTREQESAQALSSALTQTVHVLSAAVEARDPYTAGHEERVAKICLAIGQKLDFPEHRLKGLYLGATIHDVGKIQVPAEILAKPTRLTPAEFELIKAHPETGARLLADVQFEWPITEMILQHHERYDGSGYPQGLRGEEISLEARVIGVADTLEAMASHRPYRPGLGLDKAAEEIRSGAGTRYDPHIAEACLALISEGIISSDLSISGIPSSTILGIS